MLFAGAEQEAFERIKESIAKNGQVMPLLVRPLWFWRYELIDGYQRLRAVVELGKSHVPCTIVKLTNKQILEAQAIASVKFVKTTPEQRSLAKLRLQEAELRQLQEVNMGHEMSRDMTCIECGISEIEMNSFKDKMDVPICTRLTGKSKPMSLRELQNG